MFKIICILNFDSLHLQNLKSNIMDLFNSKQTKNFMLDDVKSLLNQGLNQEELINLLTAQKIEYGRLCINQFLMMTYNTTNEQREDYHYKLDVELTKRIKELGLKPIEIYTIEK